MEAKRIIEIRRMANTFLQDERLKQAIEILGESIEEINNWELRTRYTEIETAYRYMLDYFSIGMPDPDRQRLRCELIGKCYMLNDEIAIARESEHSLSVYSQHRRKYKNSTDAERLRIQLAENAANLSVTNILPESERKSINRELADQHEKLLAEAFMRIWCCTNPTKSTLNEIYSLLTERKIGINDRATLVSAVTLGMLKCFDPQKAVMLCNLSMHDESDIAVRALTGLVIILTANEKRIKYYPALNAALESLKENTTILKRIETTQIQLLRSRETQKIDKKMREEIIPAMMKNPNIGSNKIGIDLIKEMEDEGQNPEWKAWIEQDKIKDKIEEMTKWQIEGADVYMSTFSQLKRFPFFNELVNWFRPFDNVVPQISEILPSNRNISKSILGAICSSRQFCNSDKYSFCFAFGQVPNEQREMLMQQIDSGEDETHDTSNEVPTEKEAEITGNQYIQDLYRFFKLSHFRHDFSDPFTLSLNLLESQSLSFLLDRSNSILKTFNYLIEKEYYTEAYNCGVMYEAKDCDSRHDAQFYQKMGYSLQKQGEYRKAIDYYTKADIVKPDTLWTIRHMAQCYRLLGEFNNALHYYETAEEIAPENMSLLFQTGECLASLKRYEEAFGRFFKVEYLRPESLRAKRAIAWCSFVTGQDEQSRCYYEKILSSKKAKSEDYMNAAHVEWVSNNRKRAIELYRQAKELYQSNDRLIENIFMDKEILIARGTSEDELLLLRDILV